MPKYSLLKKNSFTLRSYLAMLCKKEAKNNSKQNKVRRNKFLKDKETDTQYSEHDLENSFDENQDNKRDNLD